jgi:hypothetical protein
VALGRIGMGDDQERANGMRAFLPADKQPTQTPLTGRSYLPGKAGPGGP